MYLAISLLTVDPNRRLREMRRRTREEKRAKKRRLIKNVPGIRADYARRERCMRVPLLFVDVVGTDVPTNADRMEREENMMLPFSLFFPRLFVTDVGVFLPGSREVFSLAKFLVSFEKKNRCLKKRRKEKTRRWFVILEIMLFVCYTSSRR